jgi:hypothetical protein
VKSQADTISE